jgi:hypothetical protein
MKKSRFTEEQITFALRQADSGTPVAFGNEARSKIRRAETRDELRMDPHRNKPQSIRSKGASAGSLNVPTTAQCL